MTTAPCSPTPFSATELVDIARQIEAAGEVFYEAAAAALPAGPIREVFEWLREEERAHAATFERMLAGLVPEREGWRDDEDYQGYMRALALQRIFPDPAAARAAVAGLSGPEDALRHALSFEKDSILFLHAIRERVREGDRKIVEWLIGEERRHLTRLSALIDPARGDLSAGD